MKKVSVRDFVDEFEGADIVRKLLDRPVAYHRIFADVMGSVVGGVFLSQAVYWQLRVPEEDEKGRPRDGFFYKTAGEWFEETRLIYREQVTARKKGKELKILEESLRGIPAKLHYRVDLNVLFRMCREVKPRKPKFNNAKVARGEKGRFFAKRKTGVPQNGNQSSHTAEQKSSTSRDSFYRTEITSETSTEITPKNQPAASGGGKGAPAARLGFDDEYGVVFPSGLNNYISEAEAVHIAKTARLDSGQVRRALAELSAEAMRGFQKDATSAWWHLCRAVNGTAKKTLGMSKEGEDAMPPWS